MLPNHQYNHGLRNRNDENLPPDLGGPLPPNKMAPKLPAAVSKNMRDPTKAKGFRAAIRLAQEDPGLLAEIEEKSMEVLDRENPHVAEHRIKTLVTWGISLMERYPEMDESEHWTDTVVLRHARYYLRLRATKTRGRSGEEKVKASTLRAWVQLLVFCISKYTHDGAGKKMGMTVLSKHDLFDQLTQEGAQIIDDLNLDRFQNDKMRIGRLEFRLMLQHGFRTTGPERFLSMLQTVLCAHVTFYATTRSSSLAASHREYLAREKYVKLGDFKFYQTAAFTWQVDLKLKNFKVRFHSITEF
ncbi:hypothetical protein FIBSPDRAFT_398554 [Athelia psychrophila]|uniref:Uncharacterized protein n=1 Tax=Athelia psychrophila TaxID=1759441 RepID=A0A167V0A6_9AGAM|nr:hypothetical protein FIBSPDRAFT_398554 [Fibularhizoctonia sp. CBS 109695]